MRQHVRIMIRYRILPTAFAKHRGCSSGTNNTQQQHDELLERITNQIAVDNSFIKTGDLASLLSDGVKLVPKSSILGDCLGTYLSTRGFDNIMSSQGAKNSLQGSSDSDESNSLIDIEDKEHQAQSALRIISSILTFPLSLSYGIQSILSNYNKDSKETLKVLVLGARSESSLPLHWWKDALYSSDKFQNLQIEFIGPHLQITSNKNDDTAGVTSTDFEWTAALSSVTRRLSIKNLSPKNKVLFHLHEEKLKFLYNYDMFVLYNPGFGSHPLKGGWKETLQYLLMSKKPILCTALSLGDLNRDLDYIRSVSLEEDSQDLGEPLEFITQPRVNPFRSLKRNIDNNEERLDMKITQTNKYIYSFACLMQLERYNLVYIERLYSLAILSLLKHLYCRGSPSSRYFAPKKLGLGRKTIYGRMTVSH